ncbi:MAG: sulfotransferase [Alphaproteobacteria bacterium]|nr:sulfotransferase [Alphaproteobacteria bacterium]
MPGLLNPTTLRALNGLGRLLGAVGVDPTPLDPEPLKQAARKQTGLEDFGPDDFEEGLAVVCASFQADAQLTPFGRAIAFDLTARALATRLQRIRLEAEQPEVFATPLNRPLIVMGLPRSGTTWLHRLLALDPAARALATWETARPFPGPGPDRRLEQTRTGLRRLRAIAPELDVKHALVAEAPEECVALFGSALWTPTFWRFAAVHRYQAWLLQQDPRPGYAVYRQLLQHFQAWQPEARLTLKLPNHTGFLDTILALLPEACVVQTHRDPAPVVASYNSLMCSMHGVSSDALDPHRAGAAGLELWAWHIERNLAARAQAAPERVFDVSYRALVADPIAVIRSIYEHFGLPMSHAFEEALQAAIDAREKNTHARHVYALADYGLHEDGVRERFTAYLDIAWARGWIGDR